MNFLGIRRIRGLATASLSLLLLLVAGCDDEDTTSGTAGAPAPSVTIAGVVNREITSVYSFVGRVVAVDELDIIPRVQGFLASKQVQEGAWVKKGDLLFEVEPDEYQADLAAAKAAAAQQEAQLALAQIELDRNTKLLQSDTVAQAQYDAALAQRDATQAQLDSANAQIKLSELNLSYTKIHAPFTGRIGEIRISEGDTVGPGIILTHLVSLSPIEVGFSLSEGTYLSILEHLGNEGLATTGIPVNRLPVHLILPNGTRYGETGRVVFVNNAVDQATGTIRMRARFDNADVLLAPGIYVTVEIEQAAPVDRLVIPQAAVQRDQKGSFVLVVGSEGTVEQRYVDLGAPNGTDFAVNSGLQAGESVITEGLQRVRPGVKVNAVAPATAPASAASEG